MAIVGCNRKSEGYRRIIGSSLRQTAIYTGIARANWNLNCQLLESELAKKKYWICAWSPTISFKCYRFQLFFGKCTCPLGCDNSYGHCAVHPRMLCENCWPRKIKCADVFFGWKYTLKTEWINVKVLRIGPKSSHRMNTYERWVRIAGCTNEMIARSIDWLYYFEPIELLWSHPTNNFYTLNSRLFRLALCLPLSKRMGWFWYRVSAELYELIEPISLAWLSKSR